MCALPCSLGGSQSVCPVMFIGRKPKCVPCHVHCILINVLFEGSKRESDCLITQWDGPNKQM